MKGSKDREEEEELQQRGREGMTERRKYNG